MYGMEFKDIIREIRFRNRLTQKEMAEKLFLTQTAIGHFENGRKTASADTIRRIALTFNVSADYLLGIEDEFGNRIK